MSTIIILGFCSSFIISFIATKYVILFAQKFNLTDDPKKRKHPAHTHSGTIPRAGGLAVLIGFLLPIFFLMPINKIIVGIIFGAILLVITGLLDDYFDLSPYLRFVINIFGAILVISFGLGIPYISNPLGGVIRLDFVSLQFNLINQHTFLLLSNTFAVLWIIAIMNFVNWSKGVDGQMIGFVGIASIIIGLLALRFSAYDISKEHVALLSFIVAGAHFGFLKWNFYPQKIMPGYSGGSLAGFLLAILSILSYAKFGILSMVLAIPIVDALYVILRRIKSKKSPFYGDAGHFHHRLLKIGWGRRRIAIFYWALSAIFGFAALLFGPIEKIIAISIVLIMLGIYIYFINRIVLIRKKSN